MKLFYTMKNIWIITLSVVLFIYCTIIKVNAQDISYYTDYLGNFHAFESGEIRQVDHLPVRNIVLGGDYIFYQDDLENLVYYSKGEKERISPNYPGKLIANRSFALTSLGGGTNIFYNKKLKNLVLERNPILSFSDSLIAFVSHEGFLNIFKDGVLTEIEGPFDRRITREAMFKVSNNTVAYIDVSGMLQLVHNNQTYEIERYETTFFWLGDGYELKVDEQGEEKIFDENTSELLIDFPGSEVFFSNNFIRKENGEQIVLIYYADDVSENTVKNSVNFRNAYYNWGGNIVLFPNSGGWYAETINFWVGTNLVAYLNEYNEFYIYDNEYSNLLENYPPLNVYASNEFVAYIDDDNEFKIYYRGNVEEIDVNAVDIIAVKDDIILWTDANGFFYYWQNGEQTLLENYTPEEIQVELNHIVYEDINGRLKGVYDGEKVEYTEEIVENFTLFGNVLRYQPNRREFKFYWKGKTY